MLSNRGLGIKGRHEEELRRKVNVLEMKCLRSLVGSHELIELGMKRCVGEQE